jgi:hypothetical protein
VQHSILKKLKTPWNWGSRQWKGNCIESPRSTTLWRWGRAAKT